MNSAKCLFNCRECSRIFILFKAQRFRYALKLSPLVNRYRRFKHDFRTEKWPFFRMFHWNNQSPLRLLHWWDACLAIIHILSPNEHIRSPSNRLFRSLLRRNVQEALWG
ncbi:hypothetical protein AVEN_59901-1 [Araneus ventricosus]|uniref:Uncharacterized protein n=1 Tax=Araneus ventricosus TaxID=182803 RepID=A0A4Y2EHW5_ARAVE|nr:hypothetical protein AVEN_59901-1 [Araneus ventricosus]